MKFDIVVVFNPAVAGCVMRGGRGWSIFEGLFPVGICWMLDLWWIVGPEFWLVWDVLAP